MLKYLCEINLGATSPASNSHCFFTQIYLSLVQMSLQVLLTGSLYQKYEESCDFSGKSIIHSQFLDIQ